MRASCQHSVKGALLSDACVTGASVGGGSVVGASVGGGSVAGASVGGGSVAGASVASVPSVGSSCLFTSATIVSIFQQTLIRKIHVYVSLLCSTKAKLTIDAFIQ